MYLRDMINISKELDNVFNQDLSLKRNYYETSYPAINIYEEGESLILMAEVPGMKKSDINIELKDDIISLTGKMDRAEKENIRHFRRERMLGNFERSFQLPYRVNTENVKASLQDGILTIKLEKDESLKSRSIQIM